MRVRSALEWMHRALVEEFHRAFKRVCDHNKMDAASRKIAMESAMTSGKAASTYILISRSLDRDP